MTPAEADAFHRDGVFVLRGALAGAPLAAIQRAAAAVRARVDRELPEGTRFAPRWKRQDAGATWGVNEITRQGWHDPVLIDAIAAPALADALAALLDRPRAWGQKLLWAPREVDYDLHWHRDVDDAFDSLMPFKPAANDHVQFNAALAEEDSFRVVPGSHRRRLTPAERAALADRTGPMPGEIVIRLAPGDVLLMDAHALHRGRAAAGAPRLTLHFSFQAQWVPLWPWCEPADWAWITSDAFIDGLAPSAREAYRRLRTAETAATQYGWLLEAARRNGWREPEGWVPPRRTYAG